MAAQGNNEEVARVLILRGASVADRTGVSYCCCYCVCYSPI